MTSPAISETDINQYRKNKGTKGSYSLLILSVDDLCIPVFLEERIGTYENAEQMLERIGEGISSNLEEYDAKLIRKESVSSDSYVLTASYVVKFKTGEQNLYVFRIYTRNKEEFDQLDEDII